MITLCEMLKGFDPAAAQGGSQGGTRGGSQGGSQQKEKEKEREITLAGYSAARQAPDDFEPPSAEDVEARTVQATGRECPCKPRRGAKSARFGSGRHWWTARLTRWLKTALLKPCLNCGAKVTS